jgi:hypothetical protein
MADSSLLNSIESTGVYQPSQISPLDDPISTTTTLRALSTPSLQTITYQKSYDNFANPERGFYIPSAYDPDRSNAPLNPEVLRRERNNGVTLLRRNYILSDFRYQPLSNKFLKLLEDDFSAVRQAGLKTILRFAYNFGSIGAEDASAEQIQQHLAQLKPVLQRNADVIAFMEAGFVGAWGEWHNSTNGLLGNAERPDGLNEKSRGIVNQLLDALPSDRMIAIRSPDLQIELFGLAPITATEAFKGSAKSRVGAHNDAFLSGIDDLGTYSSNLGYSFQQQKDFLRQNNLFAPQGGETEFIYGKSEAFSTGEKAVQELAYLRYSTLNAEYSQDALDRWAADGKLSEIQQRLGYRFSLVNATLPTEVKVGQPFAIDFTVANEGFASPYNSRHLDIVLRNQQTGAKHVIPVNYDPRFWAPGQQKRVNVNTVLPGNLAPGQYEVLVHLPDPKSSLRDRSEYSIRLANQNVWEPTTGYNSLQARIAVTN